MNENKIRLVVVKSGCPFYKAGDSVYLDGALIDKEKSGNLCMTALNAVFPFVYSARKGILKEGPVQCPDCGGGVEFIMEAVTD